jgi:kumamolisin
MKRMSLRAFLIFVTAVCLLYFSPSVLAQGHVMTPKSSLPQPPTANGQAIARTHLRIYAASPDKVTFGKAVQPNELPPFPGVFFETPASLGCIYRLVPNPMPGCNPTATTENPSGGSRVIAVVEAFDDPTAQADLNTFSAQFGLPPTTVTTIYAGGSEPPVDPSGGWEVEASTDIQWAHAMAPGAQIILVEAPNALFSNLIDASFVAGNLVSAAGGGEVSMSWGIGEFLQEPQVDPVFTAPNVVYVASAGDLPGAQYPSTSPNVVSAGGTTISRDANTGNFILENVWQDTGGGTSAVEPRPKFQDFVRFVVGNARGTPDVSFDSNPNSGVWVYDSNPVSGVGWYIVGGTSVAAPSWAGIINAAGGFRASGYAENADIYRHLLFDEDDFHDIVFGNCGINVGTFAFPGYDLCTGIGSDKGLRGK